VQLVKRDLELAPEVALVAGQLGEGVVLVEGIVAEDPGEGVGFAVSLDFFGHGGELQAQPDQAAFHGIEAAAVPHRAGEAVDQILLKGTDRLKVVVAAIDE
jgi:hypothetical protein